MKPQRKCQAAATYRSLPDLPNELYAIIAAFLGNNDFLTFASLALTCRTTNSFFQPDALQVGCKTRQPDRTFLGGFDAMEAGTLVDQVFRFNSVYGQPKSHFERELQSYTCGHYPSDSSNSTFTRHTENDQYKRSWGTALHFAAAANQLDAAELLLKAGTSFQGRSFGLCSMSGPGEACVHSFESAAKEFFPMHTAVCYGHKEMIELFLRYNATTFYITDSAEDASLRPWVDSRDTTATPHATTLHIAASLDRIDLVEMFARDSYIWVNGTDCDGRTPLHYAALGIPKQPRAVIRKLVELGANDTDFQLTICCVAEGRCTVAIDLLHLRAYKNLTTKRLGDLLHAAITPAALYTPERGISVKNLRAARYIRYSVLLHRNFRGTESCSQKDRDSREREELVRLLVKELGVDVNRMLPSIPGTPVTLVARCNGASSSMLRCLLEDLGADITKTNRNGDTAAHCAMRLYSRRWKKLDQGRSYRIDHGHNGNWEVGDAGVGTGPNSVLLSLVSNWPRKKIHRVNKKGRISVWNCIFNLID